MLLEPFARHARRAAASTSCRNATVLSYAPAVADKGSKVAGPGCEHSLALAIALRQLPGTQLVVRDMSGRERRIGPSRQATVIQLRKAA